MDGSLTLTFFLHQKFVIYLASAIKQVSTFKKMSQYLSVFFFFLIKR